MDSYDKDLSDDDDDNDDDEHGLLWGEGWTRAREMMMMMTPQKLWNFLKSFKLGISQKHLITINFCKLNLTLRLGG